MSARSRHKPPLQNFRGVRLLSLREYLAAGTT